MSRSRLSLSIALVLCGAAASAPADHDALVAKLGAYTEEWRPCQEAASKLMENALARSNASAQNRNADYERLAAEGDAIKKDIAKRGCPKIQERVIKELRGAGASDAEMQAAWGAFVKSFAPAEPKAAEPEAAAPSASPANAATPDALAAALAPHREAWRPCQDLLGRLQGIAPALERASAKNRYQDMARHLAEIERIKKEMKDQCSPVMSRLSDALKQTGASQAEMDAAWIVFTSSFGEAPSASVGAQK
jgi:hypothetical protein